MEQPADQRRLAVIDMADDDDAHLLPRHHVTGDRGRAGAQRSRGDVAHHMYPAARSRSNASSVSRSMARPARSGARVCSSSSMISSMVAALPAIGDVMRSEEHTSELQSLMRISYAVFCLQKKKSEQAHIMYNHLT